MSNERVVVDGSNIATEGRTTPSLAQLDEAVRALMDEYPEARITVVVDATFGHRIDPSEREAYEEAVLAGELVSPPAGAIGRGDAFVLQIADKANATVFSNDSFQEFHGGQYDWLFDEGRLVGGKPVPDVGWIFVLRTPVRGPTSRRATREARSSAKRTVKTPLVADTAKAKPEAATTGRTGRASKAAASKAASKAARGVASSVPVHADAVAVDGDDAGSSDVEGRGRRRRTTKAVEPVNDPVAFLHFVSDHPVGSTVEGVVDRFSSHGAYVNIGTAQGYVPLRLMADPAPTSAKQYLAVGETRSFVVDAFDTPRRSIDLALPGVERTDLGVTPQVEAEVPVLVTEPEVGGPTPYEEEPSMATNAPTKRAAAKKSATANKSSPAKKATATNGSSTGAAKKAPARKVAAKKTVAAKATAVAAKADSAARTATSAAKKATTAAKKTTAAAKKATTAAKDATAAAKATKTTATKATASKTTAAKAPAKKATTARKTTTAAKKAPAATKTTAKKATATTRTTAAKKTTATKATAAKAPAKKTATAAKKSTAAKKATATAKKAPAAAKATAKKATTTAKKAATARKAPAKKAT